MKTCAVSAQVPVLSAALAQLEQSLRELAVELAREKLERLRGAAISEAAAMTGSRQ